MELLPKNATGFISVTLHLQFYLYPIPTKLEYLVAGEEFLPSQSTYPHGTSSLHCFQLNQLFPYEAAP